MLAVVARRYPLHIVQSANQIGNVWTVTLRHEDGGPIKQVKIYMRRRQLYVETSAVWRSPCATTRT